MPEGGGPVVEVSREDARQWNNLGSAILWPVNEFKGPRRKENLSRVLSWAIDIDTQDKALAWNKIDPNKLGRMVPSLVVETANGFHVYFDAEDGDRESYSAIVGDRLQYYFDADANALDLSRLLRVPGYMHQKDKSKPFLVRELYRCNVRYTREQMLSQFPLPPHLKNAEKARQEVREVIQNVTGSHSVGVDITQSIDSIPTAEALVRLSGTQYVNYETFELKRVANGNLNIWVNGKSTANFIDKFNRIGSMKGGGPTIWQWLNFYHRDHKTVFQILTELFPEHVGGSKWTEKTSYR